MNEKIVNKLTEDIGKSSSERRHSLTTGLKMFEKLGNPCSNLFFANKKEKRMGKKDHAINVNKAKDDIEDIMSKIYIKDELLYVMKYFSEKDYMIDYMKFFNDSKVVDDITYDSTEDVHTVPSEIKSFKYDYKDFVNVKNKKEIFF